MLTHNDLDAATGGIWRAGATAVLKIATPGRTAVSHCAAGHDPGRWNFWRREVRAYRSGLASTAYAEGGIRAPELLAAVDQPDGSVALWLEDVAGQPGPLCSPDELGDLARRLGAGHAARLRDLPSYDWLSRDWLRDYTTSRPVVEPVPWDHPVAAAAWPPALRERLRALWQRRHELLAATDRLPRTLCHHDLWPMNLVVAASGPVLLDWAFVGPGPVGEDAANLILDTFFDGLVDVALLDEVVVAVAEGYLDGLGAAVDVDVARRSIPLTGAAKHFWLAPRMLTVVAPGGGHTSQTYDLRDEAVMFAGRRRLFELLTEWAVEALG